MAVEAPRYLVLGASGLAGKAIMGELAARDRPAIGASRSGPDLIVDAAEEDSLVRAVAEAAPTVVINCIADVSVARCEADPGAAWRINARPVAILAELAVARRFKLVHISTDHFFSGDGALRHAEDAPVRLLNEYARTKYAAEGLALTAPGALVARTNIVGTGSRNGGSFAEWCLDVIANDREATFFDDQFVSSIDVRAFARALIDLGDRGACGIINVASRDVFSKADFAFALAERMGIKPKHARRGGVRLQTVARPDSLGLDVALAEGMLGRTLPTLAEVIEAVHDQAAGAGR